MLTRFIMRFFGLRIRILTPVITLFLAGVLAMLFLHFRAMEKTNQQSENEEITLLFTSIRQAIDHPMRVGDGVAVQKIVTNLKEQAGVYITDEHGRISYAPDAGSIGRDIREILKNAIGLGGIDALTDGAAEGARITSVKKGDSAYLIGYQEVANEKDCSIAMGHRERSSGACSSPRISRNSWPRLEQAP